MSASVKAVLISPDLMTADNISALSKGHGGLNIAAMCAANAMSSEILEGRNIMMKALNLPEIEADIVIRKGVEAAKLAGAIPANAALITAGLIYIAGSNVRAGCPGGNRKLGASARMIAEADKGGVLLIPAGKSTNKITAFPAVHSIYHAIMEGKLTQIRGADLPGGVGGPLYGHGALGEDYVFPELCENAARIGTESMINAFSGMGMRPNRIISAILATAATMEILHADAEYEVEIDGTWVKTDTAEMAGRAAVKTAKLPEKLHFRGISEEVDTARLVGDLGLMFKDIGTPTVVGIIAFGEILTCFEEMASPICSPQAHQGVAESSIVLRVLYQTKSMERAKEAIMRIKEKFIDPEFKMIAENTIALKAHEISPGPVTDAIIKATKKETLKAVTKRAKEAHKLLKTGKSISEVVRKFESDRVRKVETRTSMISSQRLGKDIDIRVKKLTGGARRPSDYVKKYYGFDIDADVEITINGEKTLLEGLSHTVIPEAVIAGNKQFFDLIPLAALPVAELSMTPHTIINITVPTAVACAMELTSPEEAAREAEQAAYITASIPGAKSRARKVGELALKFMGDP